MIGNFILSKDDTVLLIVDIQDKLAAVMSQRQKVIDNNLHLIELAKMLDIPVVVTEQYPKGLGPTVPEIKAALPSYEPFEKLTFSCCRAPAFPEKLVQAGRKKIILTGMETHICVLQTCLDLLAADYVIHAVADGICSRTKDNWKVGLELMREAGAAITCTETVLFQLLGTAGSEEFKVISKRIK